MEQRPVVVSTSSIALQKAILTEYIPFYPECCWSRGSFSHLFGQWCGKGRNTLSATTGWNNESKRFAINRRMLPKKKRCCLSRKQYDMDSVKNLSGFDRRLVCVPSSAQENVGQADVPLSEVSGRIQEAGYIYSNLQPITTTYWQMRITEQKDTSLYWRITGP